MTPTLTIGMPISHELSEHAILAVKSIFAQSLTDWELVIVGDAPSPELHHLMSSIQDERVRYFPSDEKRNLPYRLNQIAELARSEYLFRMDGDDIMTPDRVRTQLEALKASSANSVLGTRAILIDESSNVLGMYRERQLPVSTSDFVEAVAATHPTVASRTAWFRNNPYDEALSKAQDKELWLRTSRFTNWVRIEEPMLYYRIHSRPQYRKYASTYKDDRRAISKHAGSLIGWHTYYKYIGRSILKQCYVAGTVVAGRESTLVARRHEAIESASKSYHQAILRHVENTHVPGWATNG